MGQQIMVKLLIFNKLWLFIQFLFIKIWADQ